MPGNHVIFQNVHDKQYYSGIIQPNYEQKNGKIAYWVEYKNTNSEIIQIQLTEENLSHDTDMCHTSRTVWTHFVILIHTPGFKIPQDMIIFFIFS